MIYSVCTMTAAETSAIADVVAQEFPDAVPLPIDDIRWRTQPRGALILPQDHQTDGMFIAIYKTPDG